jgi:hypothetical protein
VVKEEQDDVDGSMEIDTAEQSPQPSTSSSTSFTKNSKWKALPTNAQHVPEAK